MFPKVIGKLAPYAAVVALLAVWHFASVFRLLNPFFLPAPLVVAKVLWTQLFVTGELVPDILATLGRFLAGYLLAAVAGVSLGLLMGWFSRVYRIFEFLVDFSRSIPSTALFPLFILFFGIGDESKILVVVWAAALIILVNTIYGVRSASKTRLLIAKTMKVDEITLFRRVIVPEASSHILAGLRIALGIGLIVVIVTEMFIGTNVGLGRRIMDAQLVYKIPEMYAAIIVAGLMGYALNRAFLHYEHKVLHWRGK